MSTNKIHAPVYHGLGAPKGTTGEKGSLYLRLDGGANTTLYVREADGAVVNAVGVLTLTGNAVANDTVTIGGVTYTFVAVPTVAYDVDIGVSASVSIDNLIAAINAGAGAGTLYGTGTVANPWVTAAAGAGDTMDVTAKPDGEAGNAVTTTANLTAGSWGDPTLEGGVYDNGAGWVAK